MHFGKTINLKGSILKALYYIIITLCVRKVRRQDVIQLNHKKKNANISRHIERTRLLLFKVTSFLNWSFRLSKGNRNFESCVIDMITLVTEYSIHLVVNSISSKDNRNIYRKYYSQNIFSLKSISLSTDRKL